MTIYEIKRIYEAKTSGFYFTRDTMKFFHQTLKDFRVKKIDAEHYHISAPMRDNSGKHVGMSERIFNVTTGELETVK